MKVEFNNEELEVVFEKYADNDRTAIQLVNEDGMLYATATVNLPDIELEEDVVAIKNYSENKGMLKALMEAEIIDGIVGQVPQGYVLIPLCRLSEKVLEDDNYEK